MPSLKKSLIKENIKASIFIRQHNNKKRDMVVNYKLTDKLKNKLNFSLPIGTTIVSTFIFNTFFSINLLASVFIGILFTSIAVNFIKRLLTINQKGFNHYIENKILAINNKENILEDEHIFRYNALISLQDKLNLFQNLPLSSFLHLDNDIVNYYNTIKNNHSVLSLRTEDNLNPIYISLWCDVINKYSIRLESIKVIAKNLEKTSKELSTIYSTTEALSMLHQVLTKEDYNKNIRLVMEALEKDLIQIKNQAEMDTFDLKKEPLNKNVNELNTQLNLLENLNKTSY